MTGCGKGDSPPDCIGSAVNGPAGCTCRHGAPEPMARIAELEAGLRAAIGYMMNARIDLETGCTKATAIKTISGGIERAKALLKPEW